LFHFFAETEYGQSIEADCFTAEGAKKLVESMKMHPFECEHNFRGVLKYFKVIGEIKQYRYLWDELVQDCFDLNDRVRSQMRRLLHLSATLFLQRAELTQDCF